MARKKEPFTASLEDARGGDFVDANFDPRTMEIREVGDEPTAANEVLQVDTGEESGLSEDKAIELARDAYSSSESYFDSSLRLQMEKNERHFHSQHQGGSKYNSADYKYRSKLFRPKTRGSMRQAEAQMAAAYFSNMDAISIEAENSSDMTQVVAADLMKQLIQFRLTHKSPKLAIPWFQIAVGAWQDAQKYGVVTSKQYWRYKERRDVVWEEVPDILGDDGLPVQMQAERATVIVDCPTIDLMPPENVRIDRAASWIDPANSSPYVILKYPMYVADIQSRMARIDPKTGQPQWRRVDVKSIASAIDENWDPTRLTREDGREDSKESEIAISEYSIAWVHENFMLWDDQDYVYWTLGSNHLLTTPQRIEDVYRHASTGDRPIVMGQAIIETHKTYPAGKPQLSEGLQLEANEIVNLRLDNVKLALSKRFTVRRGRQVDLRSLVRNVPGSATLVSDHDDVKALEFNDVTSSSFAEQDRVNADFDEIAGSFSPASIETNRRMNETVGGMQLLSGTSNALVDLDIRTFTETWTERVLRQIVRLEQVFESDANVIAIAGQKAQIRQKYGVNSIDETSFMQELVTTVNVGIGATDPQQKLNRFMVGAKAIKELLGPVVASRIKPAEVIKEVFAPLGYRDGSRFFDMEGDPMVDALMKDIEELEKKLEDKQLDSQTKIMVARIAEQAKVVAAQIEQEGRYRSQMAEGAIQAQLNQEKHLKEASLEIFKSVIDAGNRRAEQQVPVS